MVAKRVYAVDQIGPNLRDWVASEERQCFCFEDLGRNTVWHRLYNVLAKSIRATFNWKAGMNQFAAYSEIALLLRVDSNF